MDSPERLRVAHLITQLELGGAQRNTLYTVKHLDQKRFEPCLIAGPGGILDDEARGSGVHVFFIPSLARSINPVKDLIATVQLYRLLRQIQPDIVHTHSSKAGILGRIAAYLAGVPVIIHTFHGFGFTPRQNAWVRKLYVRLERACAKLSTHLVFVSEDNRHTADELGIGLGKSSSLIRSGIVIDPESPTSSSFKGDEKRQSNRGIQEKLKIPENAWVVTYVGNFKPQKNTMDLAKVAEIVLLQKPDVHFVLVGDGDERDAVKRFVSERQLEERVHLLGWLKRRGDIQEMLEFSNCFLLTSLWEGLPRALVEAFAARLPAVAYAADGVRDILKEGDTGFPITPGNIEQAAEKIMWLKANPDKAREMGQRARRLIEKEFNIDTMVRQQEELYEKLFNAVPLKEFYRSNVTLKPTDDA